MWPLLFCGSSSRCHGLVCNVRLWCHDHTHLLFETKNFYCLNVNLPLDHADEWVCFIIKFKLTLAFVISLKQNLSPNFIFVELYVFPLAVLKSHFILINLTEAESTHFVQHAMFLAEILN